MYHVSGYLHVEHQLGLSASETIRAKKDFERIAMDHDAVINSYLYDNGTFRAKDFIHYIYENVQKIHYCGVNDHHKNGVAEHSIHTVSECARSLLLHSSTCWKSGI